MLCYVSIYNYPYSVSYHICTTVLGVIHKPRGNRRGRGGDGPQMCEGSKFPIKLSISKWVKISEKNCPRGLWTSIYGNVSEAKVMTLKVTHAHIG